MTDTVAASTTPGNADPRDMLRRALDQGERIVSGVTRGQADLSTPCEGWTVRHLVEHLITALRFHTGVLTGTVPPGQRPAPGTLPPVGDDWLAEYQQARAAILAAWQRPGALEGTYHMPFGALPGTAFVPFTTLEVVMHTWDLAKATGQLDALDPALGEAALQIIQRTLPAERPPEIPFRAVVSVPETAPVYDRLAAYAGRQP